ncbi:MAG: glucosyltransferase domain-containing protein [Clostridia bacterium]|nr:glucosyltransferase domain-containing protein [Clostridia bacterium]
MERRETGDLIRAGALSPSVRAAFFGALLIGLVSQGMGMFNKFSWHDDIFSLFMTGDTITSGRWMLFVLAKAEILIFGDGHFSLPLLNGLFSLLCIGASAGLIADLLKIRSRALSALLGGTMAAFPVITSLFSFMFTAPYYMLSLLLMALAGWLILGDHSWKARAFGVLLGGCSVGIYQAFLPLILSLTLLYDLKSLMDGAESPAAFFRHLLLQALCLAGIMAVYLAGSRIFLAAYGLELSPYMGISQSDSLPLETYLARAGSAWLEFFRPTRYVQWDMYPQHVHYLYLLMLVLDGVMALRLALLPGRKGLWKAAAVIPLLLLFPLACNFIFVLSGEVHGLMVYGQVMQTALFVLLADRTASSLAAARLPGGLPRAGRAVSLLAALILGLGCAMYARYDNQCYLKTAFQQQQAIAWNTELVARIKSAPGFREDQLVVMLNRDRAADGTLYNIGELDFLKLTGYDANLQEYVNNWAWDAFLQRWCGFGSWLIYETKPYEDWPEVQAMPSYPEDGSIQVVRDLLIVKF